MAMESMLNELNDKQREAVFAPLQHTLVLAGAGSGKTKVLVSRIAWLIEHYAFSPHAILAVTFTNKAAGEMKARLSQLLMSPVSQLMVGTFHGLCHRLLRMHYEAAHLPQQFHILDSDDQARLIKKVLVALNLDLERWPVKQAQAFINNHKDEGLRPQHIHAESYGPTKTWIEVYAAYEKSCAIAGAIDFAELLLRTYELLRHNPVILELYQQRFKAILVDEFQDTNTIQYAWIKLLAGDSAIVMAVGDDDQSIYGWRGAKVENIHKFTSDFAYSALIRLEQNYRSTSTILTAANALIQNNQGRLGKELWTEGQVGEKIQVYRAVNELDEARFIAERMATEIQQNGHSPDDMVILYRSNAQSRVLEEALLRKGIAYRIHGGLRFFERAEVKDALSYMRLMANCHDDTAFERIVNFPTRGIGDKSLDEIRTIAKTNESSLWDATLIFISQKENASARAILAVSKFVQLIQGLQERIDGLALDEQFNEVISASGLEAHFSKVKSEQSLSRIENLQELVSAARQFRYEEDVPLLVAFLAHASLEAGEMQAEAHEVSVHLMTLHAAKGLEFPFVFLAGLEEGLFPSKLSFEDPSRLEEERRLCYVGLTRAMRHLIISYAEVRRIHGREEYHVASRFLKELPVELLQEVRVRTRLKPQAMDEMAAAQESGLSMGQMVNHSTFGQGVVIGFEGSGAHTRVQVRFEEGNPKWLVLAYANLVY